MATLVPAIPPVAGSIARGVTLSVVRPQDGRVRRTAVVLRDAAVTPERGQIWPRGGKGSLG